MSTSPPVLAVCVNWNGSQVLPALLDCLLRSRYPSLTTLVVDNDSADGSTEDLPDDVQLMRLEENKGYGGAINEAAGSRLADPDLAPRYFLLLNNDLEFDESLVQRLVEFAETRPPGVFGPKVLDHDQPGLLEAAWGEVVWNHVLARFHGKGRPDEKRWSEVRQVELLLGCALLVHADVFQQVGFFDESFFMYHEEVDFLYRCKLVNVPVFYCPFASVRHRGAHSWRRQPLLKTYWLRRNTVVFFRKHHAGAHRWLRFLCLSALSLVWNTVTFQWRRAATIFRGLTDGFRQMDTAPR